MNELGNLDTVELIERGVIRWPEPLEDTAFAFGEADPTQNSFGGVSGAGGHAAASPFPPHRPGAINSGDGPFVIGTQVET